MRQKIAPPTRAEQLRKEQLTRESGCSVWIAPPGESERRFAKAQQMQMRGSARFEIRGVASNEREGVRWCGKGMRAGATELERRQAESSAEREKQAR